MDQRRNKIQKTYEDLEQSLRDQIKFLRNSIELYDAGDEREARRLAVTIRILLHDTRMSQSLLGLLGLKDIMSYMASGYTYNEKKYPLGFWGLTMIEIKSGIGRFRPRCLTPPKPDLIPTWKSFEDWWDQIIIVDLGKQNFTRHSLVLTLADMDGGAHVDPTLYDDWTALTRYHSMRFFLEISGTITPIIGIETASCRQIAEELISSIHQVRPDLKDI